MYKVLLALMVLSVSGCAVVGAAVGVASLGITVAGTAAKVGAVAGQVAEVTGGSVFDLASPEASPAEDPTDNW